jgi:hypothetical protein
MFEATKELQENHGIRGIINRHFGKIDTPEQARKTVAAIAKGYLWIAGIQAVVLFIIAKYAGLFDCAVIAGLGYWLLHTRSRIIACALLVWFAMSVLFWVVGALSLLTVFLLGSDKYFVPFGGNIFILVALLAMAWRATYATFRFHGKWENPQDGNPVAVP